MAYLFYFDKVLLPIAPSSLDIKVNSKNQTYTLINDGEINILKQAGLSDVSFDVLLPQVRYPFAQYKSGFQSASYFLDVFEKLKTSDDPFQFIVTRAFPNGDMMFDTNMKVSLEDYTIGEDTANGLDLVVKIKLKQYRDYGTKTANIKFVDNKPKASVKKKRSTKTSPKPKKSPKTHTVKRGEVLWTIAKEYYGNGSQFQKIYNANRDKIKNPNLIYPGQKLTIPV